MKATIIKSLRPRRELKAVKEVAAGIPLIRTKSRAASIHESSYSMDWVMNSRAAAHKHSFRISIMYAVSENPTF
jgi:H+-transporting ATPase